MKTSSKLIVLVMIVLAGAALDLYTKQLAVANLKEGPRVTVIEGCLEFSFTQNRGTVFGLFGQHKSDIKNTLLIVMMSLTMAFVGLMIWRLRHWALPRLIPFSLTLGGAGANLSDRIRLGSVVDFIHIHAGKWVDWPYLFNVADVIILVGLGLLILSLWRHPERAEELAGAATLARKAPRS